MPTPWFNGESYDAAQDGPRLEAQLARVKTLMRDGQWRTLGAIAKTVGGSEAGISARLRDLRKARFGSYIVQRQRVTGGLHKYRVVSPPPQQLDLL